MLFRRCLASLLLTPLLSLPAAFAQGKAGLPAPQRSISLDVVVAANGGAPVRGLQRQDFSLFNNKAPQPITSFQALGSKDAPVEVLLVVDAANTSYESVAFERGQIDKFLRANGGHLSYPTTLGVLTDRGMQIQEGFSRDGASLSASLDQYTVSLRSIRRSAGFYGAAERFQLSLQALRLLAAREATRPGRKLILWISPGWPLLTGPGINLDAKQQNQIFADVVDLSNQLRRASITLYAIDPLGSADVGFRNFYYQQFVKGVSKPSQAAAADLSLQVVAAQSGGLVLYSSNDVSAFLNKCLADAEAYYEIVFTPAPADHPDEYHHLEMRVARPGLTARTRRGYYAQP